MRITAGNLKGRKISKKILASSSKHGELRPTSSKARESIFNIIGKDIPDAIFVDLYAGTGAVGIEAISRGAKRVFFVEADRKRAGRIEEALKNCGCDSQAEVIMSYAADFVRRVADEGFKADIIFLDPPYHSEELDDILALLSGGMMTGGEGVVLAEHSSKKVLPDRIGMLLKKKDYKYGDTMLTLFRRKSRLTESIE